MSSNKYSIDDILREAAKIRDGENFSYGYGDSKRSGTVDEINTTLDRTIHIKEEPVKTVKPKQVITPKKEQKQFIQAKVTVTPTTKSVVMATKKAARSPYIQPTAKVNNQEDNAVLSIIDEVLRNKKTQETEVKPQVSIRKKQEFSTPDLNANNTQKKAEQSAITKKEVVENFSATNRKFDKTIEMDVIDDKPVEVATSFIKKEESFSALDTEIKPIEIKADYTKAFTQDNPPPVKKDFTRPPVAHRQPICDQKTRVVERSAVMKIDSKDNQKTGDFQAIPTIVSVDEYQTHINEYNKPKSQPTYPVNDGMTGMQLTLDGKEAINEPVEKIDEEVAEQELYERRKKKVGSFSVFGLNDDIHTQEPTQSMEPIDDYNHPNDKDSIWENLKVKKSKISVKIIATTVITAIIGILSMLFSKNMLGDLIGDQYIFISIISALLIVLFVFNITTIKNGISGLFKGKIDSDFPVTFASLLIVAQQVLSFIFPNLVSSSTPNYAFALGVAMLCNQIGKHIMVKRIMYNFKFLVNENDKYTIQDITNQKDVDNISKGLLMGNPVIKHAVKTEFPVRFLDISYKYEPADKTAKRLSPIMISLSVLAGAICYIVTKDWMLAFTSLCACSIVTIPIVSLMATNTALYSMSKEIKGSQAMVVGYEGARELDSADAIVFDSSDLFPQGSCSHHGWKFAPGVNIVEALLQTASVVISTNSPLREIFDKMIVGKQSILPDIDTVVYEERMGTSAWIYGKKVLVGNRKLMIHHGVKGIPNEEWELKRQKGGSRNLLYLAIDGRATAIYSVSYSANDEIKEHLHRLEKTGLTILVKSNDPFIDEDMLCKQFDLEPGFVRVLNSASGRVYEKYENINSCDSPAYATYDGSAKGLLSAMYASSVLLSNKNIFTILQIFGCILGFAVVMLLSMYNALGQIGAGQLVLFQLVWSTLAMIIAKYKK